MVTSIAASMLSSGFRQEEVVVVRNSLSDSFGTLLFGDGMKRGCAAKLCYCLIRGQALGGTLRDNDAMRHVFQSLLQIPVACLHVRSQKRCFLFVVVSPCSLICHDFTYFTSMHHVDVCFFGCCIDGQKMKRVLKQSRLFATVLRW